MSGDSGRGGTTLSIARWLSVLLHPFVMIAILVGMAAASRQSGGEALRSVTLVAAFAILPLAYVMLRQPQSFMVQGILATFGMLAVCGVATRWIKVSLHMAFATFVASALALARSPVGYALGLVIGAFAGLTIHYL